MKTSIAIMILSSLTFCQDFRPLSKNITGINQTYFPLMLGNEWLYSFGSTIHSEKITDTARIHGYLYYGLSYSNNPPSEWLRRSNDSVFIVYHLQDTVENLLYLLNANAGDSWNISPASSCMYGTKITLLSTRDTIISPPADTFYNCCHFQHTKECIDAGIWDSWFAKGIGRVKYTTDNIWGMAAYILNSYKEATSVKLVSKSLRAIDFILYECYPNPFNPATTLQYEIHQRSYVTLKIYDMLGRETASLVNEFQYPGFYTIPWNASEFPSGVYFARLSVNDLFQNKKLLLAK